MLRRVDKRMEEKVFRLTDFNLGIRTPISIKITTESKSFLISNTNERDIQLEFECTEKLPKLPKEGFWRSDRYYTQLGETSAMYIRALPTDEPYAMVQYDSNDFVKCFFVEKKELINPEMRFIWNIIGLEQLMLRRHALILHASFIRWNEKGILFSAPSGIGKSTQANLWQQHLGADIINGDRAGMRKKDGRWKAYGLPCAGSSRIYHNESAVLNAIVVLEQSSNNSISRLGQADAMIRLLPEFSLYRWDTRFMNKAMDLIAEIVEEVPVYLLKCRPDAQAVQILREMIEKEENK